MKSLILFFCFLCMVMAEEFYGLNYGINPDACPSLEKVKEDYTKIKEYTDRVRSFSLHVCDEGQLALQASQSLGMRIYLGMWIDRPDTFDAEMNALKTIVENDDLSNVDAIIVGSEVLYRGDTDENTLANYIAEVKKLVGSKGVPVTSSDVYYKIPPVVVDQVDFVMMNAFPYWEGVNVEQGAEVLLNHYNYVVSIAHGKPVFISETGWPSDGGDFGASVASPENQKIYLRTVLCAAQKRGISVLWYSAFDQPYRGGVEAHWGIMNENGQLKPQLTQQLLENPC
ncbi:glycoside hydrolase superfamily [Pilobolus umbonatus]|nr:glycoside hydrolase superfamily [Pilobolus umbonatus]